LYTADIPTSIGNLINTINNKQSSINALNANINNLNAQGIIYQTTITSLQQQIKDLNDIINKDTKSIICLTHQVTDLQNQQAEAITQISAQKNQIDLDNNAFQSLSIQHTEELKTIHDLRARDNKLDAGISNLGTILDSLNTSYNILSNI